MKNIISLLVFIFTTLSVSDTYAQDKYITVFAEKFWVDTSAKKILQKPLPCVKSIIMTEEANNATYDEFQLTMSFSYLADHELFTNEVADAIHKQEHQLTKTGVNMFLTKFGKAPTIVMVVWMPINQRWFIKAVNLGLVCPIKGDRIFHGPNIY